MPIVQVISIIGKPNLWNRAQREFMLWVPTLKFLWRWKLNLRKSVNPTLLEVRFNCKAFGKRICNTAWCLVLFLNERLYSCVPLKVHPSASPSIPLRFIPPLLLVWRFLSSFALFSLLQCICLSVSEIRFWSAGVSKLSCWRAWQARYPLHRSGNKVWVFKHYGRVKRRGK